MTNPLPSWHDGKAKQAILDIVARVTDDTNPDFVPHEARIATFDNDGTLWCEQPMYVQADFLLRRFGEQVKQNPDLAQKQPYKAVVEHDTAYFGSIQAHLADLAAAIAGAYAGITPEEFEEAALNFFDTAQHPRFNVPYAQLTYQPMHKLMDYLRANDFKVFVTTGGGRDFVRVIGVTFYRVPRENVIGSAGGLEFKDGQLLRAAKIDMQVDDGAGKPVHIYAQIGRRPALAVGNSDGDFEMLQFAKFGVLIHHDDAKREYAYDKGTERALAAAPDQGWVVVSMANDWSTVFAQ